MNRKVILYISTSIDGFIADKTGSVSWINGQDEDYKSDYGYDNFIKNIDTVILGYNTYKQIIDELSPTEWVYKGLKSYVFTNKEIEDTTDIKFVKRDIISFIEKLKKEDGKDIWICGGANILNQLVKSDLIDEYRITTVPIILGNGIRLFDKNNRSIKLKLIKTNQENGMIENIYIKR